MGASSNPDAFHTEWSFIEHLLRSIPMLGKAQDGMSLDHGSDHCVDIRDSVKDLRCSCADSVGPEWSLEFGLSAGIFREPDRVDP